MNNMTLTEIIKAILAKHDLASSKLDDVVYEMFTRHTEDEDEFLWGQGWEANEVCDQMMLSWMVSTCQDYLDGEYEGSAAEKSLARKLLLSCWRTNSFPESHSHLGYEGDKSNHHPYKFIDNEIAKKLPEGFEVTTYSMSTRSGSSCVTRRIVNGKWKKI